MACYNNLWDIGIGKGLVCSCGHPNVYQILYISVYSVYLGDHKTKPFPIHIDISNLQSSVDFVAVT